MRQQKAVMILLLLLSSALCFFGSHRVALFDTDEPRYAQAAKEMLTRGDWVLPTFNGQPRYAKPVFFYWMLIGAYRVFGINEFAARFWSGVAAIAIALVLFMSLRGIFNVEVALASALCWLSAVGTQLFAHAANTDMLLTLFMTLAIIGLWRGFCDGESKALLVGAISMGLAILTKGPVGLVLPLLIVFVAIGLSGNAQKAWTNIKTQSIVLLWGCVALAAIVLPWYVAITIRTEGEFLRQFLLTENFARYLRGQSLPLLLHAANYPAVLWGLVFPWSALGVWMLLLRRQSRANGQSDWRFLLSVWAFLPVLFFSFSRIKNPQYVLLSAPALAALAGLWFVCANERQRRWGRWAFVLSAIAATLLIVSVPFALNAVQSWHDRLTFGEPVELGFGIWLVALASALLPFVALLSHRSMLIAGVALMIAFNTIGLFSLVPAVSAYRQEPLKHFAKEAAKQLCLDDLLIVYKRDLSSVVFYSERRVLRIDDPRKIAQLASNGRVDVLTRVKFVPELLTHAPLFIVERQHGLVWLSNKPVRCSSHP